MKFKILIITCFLIYGCGNSEKSIKNKTTVYKKVLIEKVIENPSLYNNIKIEIEGYFYFRMEDSSISNKQKSLEKDRIWVDFNFFKDLKNERNKLLFKNENLMNYVGKKIKLRGVYDIEYNGHLASYKGSIKVVSFLHKDENYERVSVDKD